VRRLTAATKRLMRSDAVTGGVSDGAAVGEPLSWSSSSMKPLG
jgi:hypothetical protein